MKRLNKNKHAEMTGKAIVELIILIASISVILLLWVAFNWNPTIDRESCHQSIILRSSFNAGFLEVSKNVVPLKCQTEKICLGGSCESEFGDAGRKNPVTKIKLSKNEEELKQEVLETIANSMYDCHSMLGEGKLDFMPSKFWTKNYCLICSRFILDEEFKGKIENIAYGDIYKYLGEKKISDDKSYLEYLYPQWKNWQDSKVIFEEMKKISDDEEFEKLDFEDWELDLNFEKGYVIVTQMDTAGFGGVVGKTVLLITAGGFIATGFGAPIGATLLVGASAGGISLWYTHPQGNAVYSPPTIYPYDLENLNSLKCSSFETAP